MKLSIRPAKLKFVLLLYTALACIGVVLTAIADAEQTNLHPPTSVLIQKRVSDLLFDPERPTPVSYQDDTLSMRLDTSGTKLGILFQNKGQSLKRIPLRQDMAQVNEILRDTATRATVIGMINGDAYEVAVIDLTLAKISDTFLAYGPSVSPSGRYLAFIKFFPTHFVEGVDYRYMLYDLTRSPSQNRPINVDISDVADVGTTVYPPGKPNREGDNTGVDASDAHAVATDAFFWNPSGNQYFFADKYQGELSLVRISIDTNGHATASSVSIPQEELCAQVHKKTCNVSLTAIDFDTQPAMGVTARFRGVMGDNLRKDFHFRDQQFTPGN